MNNLQIRPSTNESNAVAQSTNCEKICPFFRVGVSSSEINFMKATSNSSLPVFRRRYASKKERGSNNLLSRYFARSFRKEAVSKRLPTPLLDSECEGVDELIELKGRVSLCEYFSKYLHNCH